MGEQRNPWLPVSGKLAGLHLYHSHILNMLSYTLTGERLSHKQEAS